MVFSDCGQIIIVTRLISIVSKPIKIAVVAVLIVVVVFVQKCYIQKMFGPEKEGQQLSDF